ncbi:hypothetical protein H4582DRAFT_2012792 [Lactarius indigo]|nr:hypothetical protein H4582DRAFT_2012792 [Lactarius indigo]
MEEDSTNLGSASVRASVHSVGCRAGWADNGVRGGSGRSGGHSLGLGGGMVVMDEQALKAQGVAALGARRKMLKTLEMVHKRMDIDDPTVPPPPPAPSPSGGPGSTGNGDGLSSA